MKITNKNELWFVLAQRTHFIHFFLCIFGTRTKCLIMDLFDDVKQTIYKEMYARGNRLPLAYISLLILANVRSHISESLQRIFLKLYRLTKFGTIDNSIHGDEVSF